MATRALVIDGIYSKGAIWKNGDGYPNGMGKDILKFVKKTGNFDVQEFYKSKHKEMSTFLAKFNESNKENDIIEIPVKDYVDGKLRFSQVDTTVTPAYLKQIESNNYNGVLASKGMLDADYKYVVLKDGVYAQGIFTLNEEKALLNFKNNAVREKTLRKVKSFRKIFMKDGKLHFVDLDNTIHQVTLQIK